MNWYYASAGKPIGPIPEGELANLFRAGTVKADTLVWHEGMTNWQPYGTLSAGGEGGAGTPGTILGESPSATPTPSPSAGAAPAWTSSPPASSTREVLFVRD